MTQLKSNTKVLSVLTLISGLLAIYLDLTGKAFAYGLFKGLTTLLIISIVLTSGNLHSRYTKLILGGLVFCLIGDLLLLDESYFVFGLASFLVAHLFFMVGFCRHVSAFSKPAILLLLSAIGLPIYLQLWPNLGDLKIPVAAYFIVILLMAWKGVSGYLSHRHRGSLLSALGACLFMLSDSILGWNKFHTVIPYAGVYILGTYWLAIYLIGLSTCVGKTA